MANKFHLDPHCVAWWPFNARGVSGGFDDMSGNGNHIDGNDAGLNTSDKKEGAASVDMERGSLNLLTRNNAGLSSNFPLKSSYGSPVRVSFVSWFKLESVPTVDARPHCLFGKFNTASGAAERCMAFAADFDGANTHLQLLKGHNAGASQEETRHTTALVVGRWYHVGLTYDDVTGAVKIRLWDDTDQTVVEVTDTHAETISIAANTESLFISGRQNLYGQYYLWDGLLDEMVFFDDILTSEEIDMIRKGLYPGEVHALGGSLAAALTVASRFQMRRLIYVPGQVLADPYPVPQLRQWPAQTRAAARAQWAGEFSRWMEEHMTRAAREIARLSQEKETIWTDA